MQSIYKYSSPKCFSQFQCSQRLSVHQHLMSIVLNVVLMWSRISSNNVLFQIFNNVVRWLPRVAGTAFLTASHSSLPLSLKTASNFGHGSFTTVENLIR